MGETEASEVKVPVGGPMVVVKPKLPVVASSVTWLYNLTPEGNPFSSHPGGI